jgi:transcriptional regulator with XRE-family HTH domain
MAHPLRAYREKLGLSQEDLAEKLGISRQMIGFIETGERKVTPRNALDWEKLIPVPKEKLCPEIFGKAAA